jgi:hypothetical protein
VAPTDRTVGPAPARPAAKDQRQPSRVFETRNQSKRMTPVDSEKKPVTEPKDVYVEPLLVQHGPLGELTGQKSKDDDNGNGLEM